MTKATINIIGACLPRDIFGITNMDRDDPASYKIQSYIQNISPLYLFDKNFSIDESKFIEIREKFKRESGKNISNFLALRVLTSLKKNIFEIANFENCDFLIIDNFFCRHRYYELENHAFITRTDDNLLNFLISNKVVPKIVKKFNFEDVPIDIKMEMIKQFCLKIRQYIDETKIIIIETRPANIIFNSTYKQADIQTSSKFYKKQLNKFKWTASVLKNFLPSSIYIRPPSVTISDYNHKWGPHILHYLPEYYFNYYIPIIDLYTCDNKIQKKDIEEKAEKIKSNFDKYIIDKYGSIITENNIFNFNKLYIHNKIYEIYSIHNTKIFINIENKSIIHSKMIKSTFYPIYAKLNQDKIMLYILINNKIFYISGITFFTKVHLSENQTWLNYVIYNNNNTISLKLYNKFLSFRSEGQTSLVPWNKSWESINLHEI